MLLNTEQLDVMLGEHGEQMDVYGLLQTKLTSMMEKLLWFMVLSFVNLYS